jgi:RNA polymerase primary sigma factor
MDDVRKPIRVGKEKGQSADSDISNPIPPGLDSAEDVDEFRTSIRARGLDVIEGESQLPYSVLEQRLAGELDEIDVNPVAGASESANDPVRVYLRQMGASPLLTR